MRKKIGVIRNWNSEDRNINGMLKRIVRRNENEKKSEENVRIDRRYLCADIPKKKKNRCKENGEYWRI